MREKKKTKYREEREGRSSVKERKKRKCEKGRKDPRKRGGKALIKNVEIYAKSQGGLYYIYNPV